VPWQSSGLDNLVLHILLFNQPINVQKYRQCRSSAAGAVITEANRLQTGRVVFSSAQNTNQDL
jgi:hypothetical protein